MMFGSVAGWFLDCQSTGWRTAVRSCLGGVGPRVPQGGGMALLSHWPLSHQHELRLLGLVCVDSTGQASATRGEPHVCRGARDSSGLWYQLQPAPWAVSGVHGV